MTGGPFRIAVIADPHVHDPQADFGQGAGQALRPAADVAKSTRVFNETAAAFRFALADIMARGIGHVVLLGDVTDDGQVGALEALQPVLDHARAQGLTFWAVPGNHDVFADTGRHRSRRLVNPGGGYDLHTSDPDRRDPGAARVVVTPRMRCLGVPDGLLPGAGFFRGAHLDWETPFGPDDAPEARRHAVRSADGSVERWLMDASYLVEPVPGVWLMMVDANVWVPFGRHRPAGEQDDFADSTGAGWSAMPDHKGFVLRWMTDVAARARHLGKRLLTFSHYPVLDALADSRAAEAALLGLTPLARRMPGPQAARAVAETGIGVHVSGHLHLNATTRFQAAGSWLVDIAVPSLAAFPAAYKIVTLGETTSVDTIAIGGMPMPGGMLYPGRLGGHATYGGFLAEHAGHLVARRHLRREWPEVLAAAVPGLTLAGMTGGRAGADIPALTVIEDFYRLRMGGEFGRDLIPAARQRLYRAAGGVATWAPLFAMINRDLARLPSRSLSVDRQTGEVRGR